MITVRNIFRFILLQLEILLCTGLTICSVHLTSLASVYQNLISEGVKAFEVKQRLHFSLRFQMDDQEYISRDRGIAIRRI